MFQTKVEIMYSKRSPYYLQQWLETFQAYRTQGEREYFGEGVVGDTDDEASDGTFDTPDLDMDEYLVDITDGMDSEDSLANAGTILHLDPKPPWKGE